MSLIVLFAISWLLISIYIVKKKQLNLIESTVIFMFVFVVSINFSWIIIDELKLISIEEKGISYMAYLLNRSVVIPFLMLIGLNIYLKRKSSLTKVMTVAILVVKLVLSKYLLNVLEVSTYKNWSALYDAIYFAILVALTILVYKWFHNIQRNAVSES